MLKQRILTALVLIPLILWTVWFASLPVYAAILAVFLIVGAWEWARLAGIKSRIVPFIYALGVCAGLALYWWWRASDSGQTLTTILSTALVWWVCALVWVLRPLLLSQTSASVVALKLLLGLVILVPAWVALVELRAYGTQGRLWLVVLFGLIWVADIAAYFSGRAFGKHKLAPQVSPGKTWEGVAGAVLGGLVVIALASLWFEPVAAQLTEFLVLAVIIVAVSVLGDLTESLAKRQAGVKDSSQLLPGHGGVLDRVDSLTSATPIFLIGLLWIQAHG